MKQARITADVLSRGPVYEEAVAQFDTVAEEVAHCAEALPAFRADHERQLLGVSAAAPAPAPTQLFELLAKHHKDAALVLDEQLSRLGVGKK